MVFTTGQFTLANYANWASTIYSNISQYDSRLSVENEVLKFGTKFGISISNASYPIGYIKYSDATSQSFSGANNAGYFPNNTKVDYQILITDNLFYLRLLKNKNSFGFQIFWVGTENYDVVCGIQGTKKAIDDSEYAIFYDVSSENKGNTYQVFKLANTTLTSPKILFANSTPFIGGGDNIVLIPNLLSSSTVANESTITINGVNYYAIGTNTLANITS